MHVISVGAIHPNAVYPASDGTPWFTASHGYDPAYDPGFVLHVTADGRVVSYHLPLSGEDLDIFPAVWGADGAFWEVDDAINGLIRVAPDGRYARFRDVWATRQTRDEDTSPGSLIAGPDGRLWLDYQHRILSVAADSPARVVATFDRHVDPRRQRLVHPWGTLRGHP